MDVRFVDFSARSAIFHVSKGLLFNRLISFRVRAIFPDKNESRNIEIQNKARLKTQLFEKIRDAFNARLRSNSEPSKYQFTEEFKKRMLISDDKQDVFEIILFQLSNGIEDESDLKEIGGEFIVYPMTFVCKECGDLQMINSKQLNSFNPKKCMRKGCNGEYEQLSLMLYCETCGNVKPFSYYYKGEPITLIRHSKDSISTWSVRAKSQPPIDLFRLMCDHKDPYDFGPYRSRKPISTAKATQQKPLTVTEGSIFIPVAETSIDIPTSPDVDVNDLEYILNAISLGKFSFLPHSEKNLKTIQGLYQAYHNEVSKETAFTSEPLFMSLSENEREKKWRERYFIDKIEQVVNDLKKEFPKGEIETLRELNDYSTLAGKLGLARFKTNSFMDYVEKITDPVIKSSKIDDFNEVCINYYLKDIIHVPSVTLVSSCYGIYNGMHKFYEPGFKPHFEPIWKKKSDPNKGFYAYSYPYETEGIIIKVQKEKICKWLKENNLITKIPSDIDDFFSHLKDESYKHVMKLLHTLSHLLMRNSSVYTGLDLQSYGEKIYPVAGAIFLYSSSSINIGGLQFIFEHEILNWFKGMKFDVNECTLDPNCIKERGACFACMYVPEFVCGYFNKDLDRDTFIGKERYEKGFWD